MSESDHILLRLLRKCGIHITHIDMLNGLVIERNQLTNNDKMSEFEDIIIELKKIFSSSSLTSLQSTAVQNQKFPIVNLVRQILKNYNYNIIPFKKSNGYDKNNKKQFIRYFRIENSKNKSENNNPENNNPENNI